MNDTTKPIVITNRDFIQAVFRENAEWAHITSFPGDPNDQPAGGAAWKGEVVSRLKGELDDPNLNIFYTISVFNLTPDGFTNRRENNVLATYVIIIDDVGTGLGGKVEAARVRKALGEPSYIVETSPGSEQWGYILAFAETNPNRVKRVQRKIIELAFDGNDPGMLGPTRYGRPPVGINGKEKYLVDGQSPCTQLLLWEPDRLFTIEGLETTLGIDPDEAASSFCRGEYEDVDTESHWLLKHVPIKKRIKQGAYDITCPWVHEHTGQIDDGAAILILEGGACSFVCNHGHGDQYRIKEFLALMQSRDPTFDASPQIVANKAFFRKQELDEMQAGVEATMGQVIKDVCDQATTGLISPIANNGPPIKNSGVNSVEPLISFLDAPGVVPTVIGDPDPLEVIFPVKSIQDHLGPLGSVIPFPGVANHYQALPNIPVGTPLEPAQTLPLGGLALPSAPSPGVGQATPGISAQMPSTHHEIVAALKLQVDALQAGENYRPILLEALQAGLDAGYIEEIVQAIARQVAATMPTLKGIVRDMQRSMRSISLDTNEELNRVIHDHIFIGGQGRFMHRESGEVYKKEDMLAMLKHLDEEEVRERLLGRTGVDKVTNLSFDPSKEETFVNKGATYWNMWRGLDTIGTPGDISPWWNHLCLMVPDEAERTHLCQYLAYTLQHPGSKINHAIIWGSNFGTGKDTILYPMDVALGKHCQQPNATILTKDFNAYLGVAKLVIFQEMSFGSGSIGKQVENELKRIVTGPPKTIPVNMKGLNVYDIPNYVSTIITTNDRIPMSVFHGDRRYWMLWTDLEVTDSRGAILPKWVKYFGEELWPWMNNGGAEYVIDWLLKLDVSEFQAKTAPPMTKYKEDVVAGSRSSVELILEEYYENGTLAKEIAMLDKVPSRSLPPGAITTKEIFNTLPEDRADWDRYGMPGRPSERVVGLALGKLRWAHNKRTNFARFWELVTPGVESSVASNDTP